MTTKEKLLLYLKENKGNWVSGELLSGKLGVSRAAICKHVRKLKEDGYEIESSTRKGYLFSKVSGVLSADEIREGLNTRVFGNNIVCLKETDSTNIRAKNLAAQGASEGTVVIAEKQTKGRGRKKRIWFSPAGAGIYVSLVLRPAISPVEAPRITLMTAVAAAEALLSLKCLNVRIKWPNDILVNGKKIGGILTEISTEMDSVDYIVVGLGLNVNMQLETFTEDIRGKATSILMETGERFSRIKLVQAYLQWHEKYYDILKNRGFEPVIQRWKELADIIGQTVRVDMTGKKIVGKVMDVDNNGVLILKDNQGRSHGIFSGDVTFVPDKPGK